MTVTLDLPPELEATFGAQARARGVPIDTFLVEYLIQHAPLMQPPKLSPDQWDQAFDELSALIPDNVPPLSDEALSRESIYTREDDW
jgi:hypothetical protein